MATALRSENDTVRSNVHNMANLLSPKVKSLGVDLSGIITNHQEENLFDAGNSSMRHLLDLVNGFAEDSEEMSPEELSSHFTSMHSLAMEVATYYTEGAVEPMNLGKVASKCPGVGEAVKHARTAVAQKGQQALVVAEEALLNAAGVQAGQIDVAKANKNVMSWGKSVKALHAASQEEGGESMKVLANSVAESSKVLAETMPSIASALGGGAPKLDDQQLLVKRDELAGAVDHVVQSLEACLDSIVNFRHTIENPRVKGEEGVGHALHATRQMMTAAKACDKMVDHMLTICEQYEEEIKAAEARLRKKIAEQAQLSGWLAMLGKGIVMVATSAMAAATPPVGWMAMGAAVAALSAGSILEAEADKALKGPSDHDMKKLDMFKQEADSVKQFAAACKTANKHLTDVAKKFESMLINICDLEDLRECPEFDASVQLLNDVEGEYRALIEKGKSLAAQLRS